MGCCVFFKGFPGLIHSCSAAFRVLLEAIIFGWIVGVEPITQDSEGIEERLGRVDIFLK